MDSVKVPLADLDRGIRNIEADRKSIASQSFRDIDILLLPTTTTIVPSVEEVGKDPLGLSPENTSFANYYGLPAISVPCGFDLHGLPIGLQMVAKPWDEVTLLYLAQQYQNATSWHVRSPRI